MTAGARLPCLPKSREGDGIFDAFADELCEQNRLVMSECNSTAI